MPKRETSLLDPGEAIPVLINLQRVRRFTIKIQSMLSRKADSYIVSIMTHEPDFVDLSLKAKHTAAAKIRKNIEQDESALALAASQALAMSTTMLRKMGLARAPIDQERDGFEKSMERIVRRLPVWAYLKSGSHPRLHPGMGFAEKGVAIILGEAGDPSNYDTVSRFWKRLALGIVDGERQQKKGGLTQAEILRIGYKPERRAEMWALADSMYRHQVTHADECCCKACLDKRKKSAGSLESGGRLDNQCDHDDNDPADRPVYRVKGAYGEVFIAEYNRFRDQDKTHGHAFAHGRRVMWKECLLDFWQAWREASDELKSRPDVPRATITAPEEVLNA